MAERYVPLSEVKALLEREEQKRGELTYEQKLSLEHARKFSRFTEEGIRKLLHDLRQNPKVDEAMAVRIADLAPQHADDLRALFAKSRMNLDEGELQKILETVVKYLAA